MTLTGDAGIKTQITHWWNEIDRPTLFVMLILMLLGFLVSFSASPAVAEKLGRDSFSFVRLHALWIIIGLAITVTVSTLDPKPIRRLSLIIFICCLALMLAALSGLGDEVKGARRWIHFSGWSLQPSELAKPTFVILVAWAFSEGARRPDMPTWLIAFLLYVIFFALLVLQPDIGQAALITLAWGTLFFIAGASVKIIAVLGLSAIAGLCVAYFTQSHVRDRINQFFGVEGGDNYQISLASQSFLEGGWLGKGPGEGTVKIHLPDAHTDFTYAVIAEEFGIVACLLIAAIFAFLVLRILAISAAGKNRFACYATSGLALLIGFQAVINIGVNVGLLPAKGMTLPFLSYGGSSFLGLSLAMGLIIALTKPSLLHAPN